MNFLGNLIWLIFGGIIIAIEYFIGSIILMITIVGIPFGIQTLKMASLALWPFGRDTRVRHKSFRMSLYFHECTLASYRWIMDSCYSSGIWHALLCITIIGIPFGLQHFKLTAIALSPFGRDIVSV